MNGFISGFLPAFASAVSALLSSVSGVSVPPPVSLALGEAQCQPVRWTEGPRIEGGAFRGVASVQCDYVGQGGGGLAQLEAHLIQRMLTQASEIYAGPIYGQTEGMPSTTYDFGMNLEFQGDKVAVRQEGYVATDEVTRLTSATTTKSVRGGGNARFLKKLDLRFDVTPGTEARSYRAVLGTRVQIQKPALIPGGIFRDEVRKAIEKAVADQRDTVVQELVDNT
jgi:hypothetical protein